MYRKFKQGLTNGKSGGGKSDNIDLNKANTNIGDSKTDSERPKSADILRPCRPTSAPGRVIFKPGRHKPEFDPKLWENVSSSEDEEESTNVDKPKKERKSIGSLEWDFMIDENRACHYTDMYEKENLIVRRGQEFKLKLKLGTFDQGDDFIRIQFRKGKCPQRNKGTLAFVKVRRTKEKAMEDADFDGWYAYMDSVNGSEVTVAVCPSALAPVGKYVVRVYINDLKEDNVRKDFIRQCPDPMYIIFNPWCKDDQVYMENEDERLEYVLCETGGIWVGSATRNNERKWNFGLKLCHRNPYLSKGQFDEFSLEAALMLLCENPEREKLHGNATLVCRDLSALVNSCNDSSGALTGNWSGDYTGGTKPTAWTGSQKILETYFKSHQAVNYGQCWVFSGVMTALCRSLGIPCRSVTNFASAHDTDGSLTIDKHFDKEGEPMEWMNGDSVWNFHVWNEGWFKRPDLPKGFDGWQAFDATPQEASGGLMQCGPASVKAIKEGLLFQNYDARFIFAEVNGDRISWCVNKNGDMEVISIVPSSVGRNISTRGPDGKRLYVTDNYKYPEGSEEERAAAKRASQFSSKREELAKVYDIEKDCAFEFDAQIQPNEDILVALKITNKSKEDRTIKIKMAKCAAFYTGRTGVQLGTQLMDDIVVHGGETKDENWTIKGTSYLNDIEEDAMLKVTLSCRVKETQQLWVDDDIVQCDKPDLDIKLSTESAKIGEKFTVTISVTNPLDMDMTDGTMAIEAPGILKSDTQTVAKIESGKDLVITKEMSGKLKGRREIVACLNTKQLQGITGSKTINITK